MAKQINKPKKYFIDEDDTSSMVQEAAVHYESMRVILGGNKSVLKPISGDADLVDLSRRVFVNLL
ncbi:MAG: hypothetical protein WDO71_14280 [Bacteroidota bacterium]